jgi:hypothetical protein
VDPDTGNNSATALSDSTNRLLQRIPQILLELCTPQPEDKDANQLGRYRKELLAELRIIAEFLIRLIVRLTHESFCPPNFGK